MDERHGQIKEGAGLEESRINTEFVDLLRKWSTPALLVMVVAAFAYLGMKKLDERRIDRANAAFREHASAAESGNPDALLRVAEEFAGVRAVGALAKLDAADVLYNAVLSGVEPGAPMDGTASGDDLVTEDEREQLLDRAGRLYAEVLDANKNKSGRGSIAIGAAYGVAAVAETRGDADAARAAYERVIEIAERDSYPAHVANARERIETIDTGIAAMSLYDNETQPRAPIPGVAANTIDGGGVDDIDRVQREQFERMNNPPGFVPTLPGPMPEQQEPEDEVQTEEPEPTGPEPEPAADPG